MYQLYPIMHNTYQDSAINMHHKCNLFGKSWCSVDGSFFFRDCNAIRALKVWVPLVLSRFFLRFSSIKLSEALHPKPSLTVFLRFRVSSFLRFGAGEFSGFTSKVANSHLQLGSLPCWCIVWGNFWNPSLKENTRYTQIHTIYYTPACFSLLRLGSNVFSKLKLWDRNFEGRLPSRHLPKSQLRMSGILAWQNLQAAAAGQFSLWSIITR